MARPRSDEYQRLMGRIQSLDDLGRTRALTVGETTEFDDALSRVEAMSREHAIAGINASIGVGDGDGPDRKASRVTLERSVGEFAHERGRAMLGNLGAPAYRQYADSETGRALAHGVSGDGTAPVTIEGDLIKFVDSNRYAVNASRRLPMPDNHAPTFKRPRTTQTTQVAKQGAEGDVLASRRLQNTGDTITKETHGGVLSVSEQEIDWTDPAMLGLTLVDLAEQYAIDTDTVLTAAIETAFDATTQTVLSNTASLALFVAGIAASAAATYATAKRMPDTLFVAVDRWAYIAALVDTTGRPAFPIAGAGPLNAAGINEGGVATFSGMNVLGLNVVVDPNFTTGRWGTACSSLVEFYEEDKGPLSVNVPSTLEVQYAYRGYVAANVYSQGLNAIKTA